MVQYTRGHGIYTAMQKVHEYDISPRLLCLELFPVGSPPTPGLATLEVADKKYGIVVRSEHGATIEQHVCQLFLIPLPLVSRLEMRLSSLPPSLFPCFLGGPLPQTPGLSLMARQRSR